MHILQTNTRFHDFSCGHRVVGHEGKCIGLHGHNYRVHFEAAPERGLDAVGRVVDFSVLKSQLCQWLEDNWDHKMLLWDQDPLLSALVHSRPGRLEAQKVADYEARQQMCASLVSVPFNPTAENMAAYLLRVIGPAQLAGTGAYLRRVVIEETRKCSAAAELAPQDGEFY